MRYLKGTVHHGILYSKQGLKECIGYSDAYWAGDLDDRKSTSAYLFQINGSPVSWRSKKQSSVALSTAEAEYIALACSSQEAIWLKQLTTELGNASSKSITIYEDIQASIAMLRNPQFHGRSKHISINFIREQRENGSLVPSLPDLFNARKKRGGAWDPKSRDQRWQNSVMIAALLSR